VPNRKGLWELLPRVPQGVFIEGKTFFNTPFFGALIGGRVKRGLRGKAHFWGKKGGRTKRVCVPSFWGPFVKASWFKRGRDKKYLSWYSPTPTKRGA